MRIDIYYVIILKNSGLKHKKHDTTSLTRLSLTKENKDALRALPRGVLSISGSNYNYYMMITVDWRP